jgi:cell wall-associated NlpC family hydrolase
LRKIAILGAVVVLLGCSTATVADDHKPSTITQYKVYTPISPKNSIMGAIEHQTMLEAQAEKEKQERLAQARLEQALLANQIAISDQVNALEKYVGKTWYVFSGSSPRGWDCSGLTRWFYGELGIEIPHSASKQGKSSGWHVTEPKIGDIVAFSYVNSKKYYHVGIYIGNNEIIHAGFKPGTRTEVIPLDSPSFKNSKITFVRIIEN